MAKLTLEASIRWPTAAVLQELRDTALLELWLQRRIEQELERISPLNNLLHEWFSSAATSLFLKRLPDLERVVFSILRLNDPHLAQELYFRLQAKEADFPQLAHFSHGLESQMGARLGPISLGMLPVVIAERLRRASPSELIPPLELDDGQVVVLRLDLLMPASQNATQQLEQELYEEWLKQEQLRLQRLDPEPSSVVALQLPGLPA